MESLEQFTMNSSPVQGSTLALQSTVNEEGLLITNVGVAMSQEYSSFPVHYSPVQSTVNEGGVLIVHVGVAMGQESRVVRHST